MPPEQRMAEGSALARPVTSPAPAPSPAFTSSTDDFGRPKDCAPVTREEFANLTALAVATARMFTDASPTDHKWFAVRDALQRVERGTPWVTTQSRFLAYCADAERRNRRRDVLLVVWGVLVVTGTVLRDVRVLMAAVALSGTMVFYWGAHLLYMLWWRRVLRREGLWTP